MKMFLICDLTVSRSDAELPGDLLVRPPLADAIKDIALVARAQGDSTISASRRRLFPRVMEATPNGDQAAGIAWKLARQAAAAPRVFLEAEQQRAHFLRRSHR